MLDKNYEKRIAKLRKRIVEMADLANLQVNNVFKGIENNNSSMIKQVIQDDSQIDKYDIKIDKTCQKIFALNQPVASDLRFILSTFIINNKVEQIGDISVSIAKSFASIDYNKPVFYSKLIFGEIFLLTQQMMSDSFNAFKNSDSVLAQSVIKNKPRIDELNSQNITLIKKILKENPDFIEYGFSMFEISNLCQQLCGIAKSIAEDVFFVVEAQMIRHNYENHIFGDNIEEDEE